MSGLTTLEHEAYRTEILAYGTPDLEAGRAYRENLDLQAEILARDEHAASLDTENDDLQRRVDELEAEARDLALQVEDLKYELASA